MPLPTGATRRPRGPTPRRVRHSPRICASAWRSRWASRPSCSFCYRARRRPGERRNTAPSLPFERASAVLTSPIRLFAAGTFLATAMGGGVAALVMSCELAIAVDRSLIPADAAFGTPCKSSDQCFGGCCCTSPPGISGACDLRSGCVGQSYCIGDPPPRGVVPDSSPAPDSAPARDAATEASTQDASTEPG